jgi:hypothetical protein
LRRFHLSLKVTNSYQRVSDIDEMCQIAIAAHPRVFVHSHLADSQIPPKEKSSKISLSGPP